MEAIPKKSAAKKPHLVKPHAHPAAKKSKVAHPVKHTAAETATTEEKPVVHKVAHGKSFYAVGRRKTAVAQILLTAGTGVTTINQIPFEAYFQTIDLQQIARQPLVTVGLEKTMNIKAKIHGGGIHAQSEALRHAISRSLIAFNPESRRTLKKLGFLKRDPRVKERKKPGLKRARRAPQFSKR